MGYFRSGARLVSSLVAVIADLSLNVAGRVPGKVRGGSAGV
jgi:hypothetical protein